MTIGPPTLTREVLEMKRVVIAAAAAALGVALGSVATLAAGPRASSADAIAQFAELRPAVGQRAAPHYEWQYHYVGHHPHLVGFWAVARQGQGGFNAQSPWSADRHPGGLCAPTSIRGALLEKIRSA